MSYNFEFFKDILNKPKNNQIKSFSGNMISVGNRHLLKMKDNTEHYVYIHNVYFNSSKRLGLNEVMFISEKTKRGFVLRIKKINDKIKEIIEL